MSAQSGRLGMAIELTFERCGPGERSPGRVTKSSKRGLLLEQVRQRRLRRFPLQREMHAFMAPVVLRMTGFAALDLNPEAEPPHASVLRDTMDLITAPSNRRARSMGSRSTGQSG